MEHGELGFRTCVLTCAKKSAKESAAAAQKKGLVSTTTTTRLTSSARAGGMPREESRCVSCDEGLWKTGMRDGGREGVGWAYRSRAWRARRSWPAAAAEAGKDASGAGCVLPAKFSCNGGLRNRCRRGVST